MTGNPEAFDDYPLRSWERLVAKPFAGADLIRAIRELRPPSGHCRQLRPARELDRPVQLV